MTRIRRQAWPTALVLGVALAAFAGQKGSPMTATHPHVRLETTKGPIVIELDPAPAPRTVENFLAYVRSGFYNGTIFHRVIPGFMIQGGGFTGEMAQKKTRPAIPNEAANGLRNLRGTVAMARTSRIDSATSQFFINLADNDFLDHRDDTPAGFGYCVFGRVVEGMDVVDAIAAVPTTTVRVRVPGSGTVPFADVPTQTVMIEKAVVVKEPAAEH